MSFLESMVSISLSIIGLLYIYLSSRGILFFGLSPILRYPYALLMVLILGISLFYAGLKLFSADNQWWIAGGTFLLVTGLQIALWAIGIRLDFLGNQS